MPPPPTIDELLRLQRAYYEVISRWERRAWGVLGLNRDNPASHDSNHAYAGAQLAADQLPSVLEEVAAFYAPHADCGIAPRLHFHIPPNDPGLLPVGHRLGWRADTVEETWRAWPAAAGHEEPAHVPGLTVSVVGPESLEALLAAHNQNAEGGDAVRRRRVWSALSSNDHTDCLLARIAGEPAAVIACVWNQGWGSIEDVHTQGRFRRRGICSAMMRHAQRIATERGASGLYLYDSDEAPDRIYARAGFEFVARVRSVELLPAPFA